MAAAKPCAGATKLPEYYVDWSIGYVPNLKDTYSIGVSTPSQSESMTKKNSNASKLRFTGNSLSEGMNVFSEDNLQKNWICDAHTDIHCPNLVDMMKNRERLVSRNEIAQSEKAMYCHQPRSSHTSLYNATIPVTNQTSNGLTPAAVAPNPPQPNIQRLIQRGPPPPANTSSRVSSFMTPQMLTQDWKTFNCGGGNKFSFCF